MAKETLHPVTTMFSMSRAVLDELDTQGNRWLEYGAAQAGEGWKLARTLRAELSATARAVLDGTQAAVAGATEIAGAWLGPFGRSAA